MENPDLCNAMGMKSNQKGVRNRRIDPSSSESAVLKPSDIILNFGGVDIANDGTGPFRQGEHIGFSYLISQKYTRDGAVIRILRDSKVLVFDVKLATHKRLIPSHIKGRPPSYYIIGGFVFSTVSVPYLRSEVLAFNGKPVKNFKSLASMVENCEEFLKFDLEYQQIVALLAETAGSATLDILKMHCIPLATSDDLKT